MKKLLLTLAAVALSTSATWADVTTMTFDGENDMAGLTRQTTTNPADVVKEVTYSQDGVDFNLEVTGGTGKGFALVNAGGANAGIFVSSGVDSQITLSVPNGHVTGATIYISGYAMASLDLTFNGKSLSGTADGSIYFWNWSDSKGGDTLTISWPSTFMARYIHSLEVTYTPDLGGKEAAGLSFSRTSEEAFVGEAFTAPTLFNPHRLPVTWTSSDPAVATVTDKGQVTIVGKGSTYIIAATEGNDQYAAGNARYSLTAIPVANSVKEMFEFAPAKNEKVKVNFPMTTYFAYSPSVYAVDEEMRACYFTDSRNEDGEGTVFSKGDIVPANWIAINDGGLSFKGRPAEPTETGPVVYPVVTSVSKADANRVVVLEDVTFTGNTASATTSAKGTTPDGRVYNFQNPFNAPENPAGTYDVTLIVKYEVIGSTEYFYLAPISYVAVEGGGDEDLPEFPESFEVSLDVQDLDVTQSDDQGVYTIRIEGKTDAESVTVTVAVPEGWDGFIGMTDSGSDPDINPLRSIRRVADDDDEAWVPIDAMLEYGMKEGNVFEFPADGEEHGGMIYLYKGDMVYQLNQIAIEFNVENDGLTGIDTIEALDSAARYINFQGIEVKNPGRGIYVKVSNGKTSKVTLK